MSDIGKGILQLFLVIFIVGAAIGGIAALATLSFPDEPEPIPAIECAEPDRAEVLCMGEFWRGYSAGLEKCGPMLGIKK